MTIFENIAFGLRVRKWKNADVKERVHELLKLIQLQGWKSVILRSFRVDNDSVWRWHEPSRHSPKYFCSMNRLVR
jgi:hypothetical protein